MKLRYAIIFLTATLLLAACSFSLAADVTPPPGYVPPTPMPTLGPLYPASAPDIQNGKVIYVEKCAPCHGTTGLGDGEQGKQLPVTVSAFALPETAHKASPAQWFTMVSQGNLDRYMPPFTSLSEQERWDVISYAFTLHTTPDEIEKGKGLFASNCASCHEKGFTQELMASKSADNIAYDILNGHKDAPAIKMPDSDAYAIAAYMRTLTFAPPPATPTTVPATATSVAAESGTPSAGGTPVEGTPAQVTPEATKAAGTGVVTGTVKSAISIPQGLVVTLHGYDHVDQTSGPQETLTLTGTLNADGTYRFDNVEMPKGRFILADVEYQGIKYESDFVSITTDQSEIALSPITIYESSTDISLLKIQQVHLYSDFASEGTTQFLEIYSFVNSSDKTVSIATDGTSVPFIELPKDATNVGYEMGQDSAPFMASKDGIAIVPTDKPYSIIAFFNLPYDGKQLEINQKLVMDTPSVLLLIPEGISLKSDQLISNGTQAIQSANFQTFVATNLKAGDTITFSVSGKPKTDSKNAAPTQNQNLLIGIGGLGLALILAGAWLYWRDRKRAKENVEEGSEEENDDEFGDPESVMDAIIALDDLHRAGKLSDEAYHKRRDELKDALKRKS